MFKLSFEANNLLITQQDSDPGLSDSKSLCFHVLQGVANVSRSTSDHIQCWLLRAVPLGSYALLLVLNRGWVLFWTCLHLHRHLRGSQRMT